MRKILAYILSIPFWIVFSLSLIIFQPIQWVCFNLFGYKAHKKSVDILQIFLLRSLYLLGTKIKFENNNNLDINRPTIIVSNHQSVHDIPSVLWFFRKIHPKFISKIELGKGIPSVSYNLKHGGSVLIDRKNPRQSIPALAKFAKYIKSTNRTAVIFPEGTRSKTGEPIKFKTTGLEILFKRIPNAQIVPLTINNSWKLQQYGNFPSGIFTNFKLTAHKAVSLSDFESIDKLIDHLEKTITNHIEK